MDETLKKNCKLWFAFLNEVRFCMLQKNFEEVVTPFLVPAGAMEAELYPFQTVFEFGSERQTLELPTSPEFHLKKLLSYGWGSLFEIKTCFRNEEYSKIHRPEFTMLEFYELGADSKQLQLTVKDLIFELLGKAKAPLPVCRFVTISELFHDVGVELSSQTSAEDLQAVCKRLHIGFDESDTFNDLFFRIWLEKIEPYFDPEVCYFVEKFPASQAALAALDSEGWADRFEIYWKGFELGNAFFELQDAEKLSLRLTLENQKRVAMGKAPHPIDEELLLATAQLPLCSGIAIGLERLFMAIYGFEKISDFKIQDLKTKLAQT